MSLIELAFQFLRGVLFGMETVGKCPSCSGTSGYFYLVAIRGEQWMDWDGNAVNFEDLSTRRGMKRCRDCGIKVDPKHE